jgi:hypothetical protein
LLVLSASESAVDHGSDPRDHDADLGDQDPDPGDHDAPIRAITMRRSSRSRWRDTRSSLPNTRFQQATFASAIVAAEA